MMIGRLWRRWNLRHASADQQVLSAWYLDGTCGEKNAKKAQDWAERCANAGNIQCQLAMVRFLTSEEFGYPDFERARHYAELVARAGHSQVLAELVRLEAAVRRTSIEDYPPTQ
jgi:TPR repeat protein